MRILVVEFKLAARGFLADSLAKNDHSVSVARNSKEALRLYRKNRGFDFVLCGLTLDGKTSGVQLMQRIHAFNPKQAYGFVTEHPVLTHPFGTTELLSFVENTSRKIGG